MYIILTSTCKICPIGTTTYVYLLSEGVKQFWCQLPEDGEVIAPKHVGAILKIARKIYPYSTE